MKISKLFHWLYTILLLLPFGLVIFNFVSNGFHGETIELNTYLSYFSFFTFGGMSEIIYNVFNYLIVTLFGLSGGYTTLIINLLTYWTSISIIWLVFDLLMYLPLLIHSWIDRGVIQ